MLRLLLLSGFALSVFAQTVPAPCRIEGRVVNSATGAPIKNAALVAMMTGKVPASVNDGHTVTDYATTSDAQGAFVFDAIVNADYVLSAERTGYVARHGAERIACGMEREAKTLEIKMTPAGLISGRVVDEDGEPVRGAEVEVLRRTYSGGARRLEPVDNESAHADGSYAIGGLTPGRYYVRASLRREETRGPHGYPLAPGRRGAVKQAFVPTFFPSNTDAAAAVAIKIGDGAEIRAIDIALRKLRAFTVSGKVNATGVPAAMLRDIELNLTQLDGPPAVPSADIEDGSFEFHDVLPGTYVLQPEDSGKTSGIAGSLTIVVRDEDVRNVVLTLGPRPTISGTIKFEGVAQHNGWAILYSKDPPPHLERIVLNADNSFHLAVAPGAYQLNAVRLGREAYVKSIRVSGQDALDGFINVTAGGSVKVEIVIAMSAGYIGGIVRDGDAEAPEANVQVCSVSGLCEVQAGFPYHGFAPGDYMVFAWQDTGDGMVDDPELRARFASQAVKVTVEEKSQSNVELKLITKQTMEAEAARLP